MIQAMNDYVLVEPITQREELAKQSKHILLKTEGTQGAPVMGKVLSISKQIKDPCFKVGDIILFNEPQPDGFSTDGQKYLPVKFDNTLAVIT